MKWIYFPFEFFTGRENMAIDSSLAQLNLSNYVFFRTYRWRPFCVSLGANQSVDILNIENIDADEIDFVKRPTGGKAVFHAGELTYSIVFPVDSFYTPKKIYEEINSALIDGLTYYNHQLKNLSLENSSLNLRETYKEKFSEACFSIPNKNELKYDLKKVVGSAQRKIRSVVLQHGSILCSGEHLDILKYLKLSDEEKKKSELKLKENTIELEAILKEKINYEALSEAVKLGMEKHFAQKFEIHDLKDFILTKKEKLAV